MDQRARHAWEWLKMKFDGTIGLGSLINLVVMICGGIAVMLSYEHRITAMESGQQQIERRLSDQEGQMKVFEQQMTRIMTMPVNKGTEP